ncbi:MAG: hypothetical protein GY679_02225 [Mycoplasma sp.]|nr:hypothetical protein [Mycoplasma sp.]
MKKFNKTGLIKIGGLISFGTAVSTAVVVPIAINKTNLAKQKFTNLKLFNKTFHNREELIAYALQSSKIFESKNGHAYFSLEDSGEKLFSSDEELRRYISNNIEIIQAKNSIKIEDAPTTGSGDIAGVKDILAASKSSDRMYYRGIKDTIFKDRIKAIESYFQYHKVFYYDGITFRNKEELKRYLYTNYDKLKDFEVNSKESTLISPDGLISDYMNLQTREGRSKGREFIKNTATSLIGFKRKDGGYNYVKREDILKETVDNNFSNNLKLSEINAVHIKPNNGNSLWITDSAKTDKGNFYGNYFTNSKSDEISHINDFKKWSETSETLKSSDIKTAQNSNTIGKLFAMLNKIRAYYDIDINNKEELAKAEKTENIFDIPKYKQILDAKDQPGFDVAKVKLVISQLKQISNTISKGKRYNPLYELPLLYSRVISYANKEGQTLNNKELNFFRKFFKTVANDYQDILESFLPKSSLVDKDGSFINIAKLFGINDISYDSNTTPEFQMYELSESPKFVSAVNFLIEAINNKVANDGARLYQLTRFNNDANITNQDYYSKMWNLLSVKPLELKNKKTKSQQIEKFLGKKVTDKQAGIIYKLTEINNELAKANNALILKSNEQKFKGIFKHYKKTEISEEQIQQKFNNLEDGYKEWFEKIKFILKNKNQNVFKENKINIPEFKKELQNIGSKEMFEYELLFKIKNNKKENTMTQLKNLFDENKLDKKMKVLAKILKKSKKTNTWLLKIADSVQSIRSGDTYEIVKSLSNILGSVGKITSSIPFVGTSLQLMAFAGDLAAEIIGKTTKHIYKFKTSQDNSNPFYWDGGRSTSRLWGLLETVDAGADSMKIIPPQKIIEGIPNEIWIYNGKVYKDTLELRRQALFDYVNGDEDALIQDSDIKNKSIVRGFTYEKVESNTQLKKGLMVKDSREALAHAILPDLNNSNSDSDLLKKIIHSSSFSIIGGNKLQIDGKEAKNSPSIKKVWIKHLLENIKPTIVVQMPKMQESDYATNINGKEVRVKGYYPKEQFVKKFSEVYELPGTKYYEFGQVKTRESNKNEYLKINMNELENPKTKEQDFKYLSVENAVDALRTVFIKNVSVKSIYSLEKKFLNTNHFSELKTPKEFNLFKATGVGKETKYFKTFWDAFKWLTSVDQFNMKTIISKGEGEKITFNNQIFNNTQELIQYLDKLLEGRES